MESKNAGSEIFDEPIAWLADLAKGDPRVLITVGSARIDDLLKSILQSVTIHESGDNDRLFGYDRPLGTFSSRILLAYRLGLIDREFESFLQTMRRLRNDTAHSVRAVQLDAPPHVDRIRSLWELAGRSEICTYVRKKANISADLRTEWRRCLMLSLAVAVFCLEAARRSAALLVTKPLCTFTRVGVPPEALQAQAPLLGKAKKKNE